MNNFSKGFVKGFATALALPAFVLVGLNAQPFALATLHGHDFQFRTGLPTKTNSTSTGNFNPTVELDTTQVTAPTTTTKEN